MKVLVLGGGYGTRLVRDIHNDKSGYYTHLLNIPKALLPIGDIPLLTHWINLFQKVKQIEHVYVEVRIVAMHIFLSRRINV